MSESEKVVVVLNTFCPAKFSTFPISETFGPFQPSCTTPEQSHNKASRASKHRRLPNPATFSTDLG